MPSRTSMNSPYGVSGRHNVQRALRDLQPERLALQRQRRDFGGTLTEAEYRIELAALEKVARRRVPAQARG
jgi:hypothetical protein